MAHREGCAAAVMALAESDAAVGAEAEALAAQGNRVLAVVAGPPDALRIVGLVALSDPPRPESAALIGELRQMGGSYRHGNR